ncbi:MAG: D-tyrosyl-tRNA(Tyr) deacylase [Flavobacteriales bacterium]|mgnify:CR=1 FL=1|nr:D-tyrosyl-tRNA(Tyr) deacylase [Flavobacteriales bacterium]|tara:strand:+ start:34 stop:486 length:453 start_codon:yes stop_codon:yes gene_type:complete
MRVTIQRVSEASVRINDVVVAEIERGILVLVGIKNEDTFEDINWLTSKISKLRIFPDEKAPMNKSIIDVNGDIIVVSQFTLFASTKKGNRPSFLFSGEPDFSKKMYFKFVNDLEMKTGKKVKTGRFGADMKVSLINDGPVTINIDTKNKE